MGITSLSVNDPVVNSSINRAGSMSKRSLPSQSGPVEREKKSQSIRKKLTRVPDRLFPSRRVVSLSKIPLAIIAESVRPSVPSLANGGASVSSPSGRAPEGDDVMIRESQFRRPHVDSNMGNYSPCPDPFLGPFNLGRPLPRLNFDESFPFLQLACAGSRENLLIKVPHVSARHGIRS